MSRNIFVEAGFAPADIAAKRQAIWDTIFVGPDRVYFEAEPDMGYIVDTGNMDVRTEGMSYGMMMAVQYGQRDVFDRLWRWVKRYMYMDEGPHAHFYAWSVDPSGTKNAYGPAPDGEEYFAMALILASRVFAEKRYLSEAQTLLHWCLHKEDLPQGRGMWDLDNHLIRFIPEVDYTDPSYHLPHFYAVFAQHANPEDREFWQQAAQASLTYLQQAMDPETGMSPEYSHYDGTPYRENAEHHDFFSDAYRTVMNVALYHQNHAVIPELVQRLQALQVFYRQDGQLEYVYTTVGEDTGRRTRHPVGLLATIAAASAGVPASADATYWVTRFWQTGMRSGDKRYYDNFLYAFSFLVLSGAYQL